MTKAELSELFTFRNVKEEEADQTIEIENICFPSNEACTPESMAERASQAQETFLVAVDKKTDKIAGFLNGIATDEDVFRDEFFTNITLHNKNGKNIMLLGLDVLPEYRGQGLAREIMERYLAREKGQGRKRVVLTCLDEKVKMYERMGYKDLGISASVWGGENGTIWSTCLDFRNERTCLNKGKFWAIIIKNGMGNRVSCREKIYRF